MQNPWLTVIIPTYNGEKYLTATFDSILAQSESDIEYIVVDDGSTDATLEIIKAYQQKIPLTLLQRQRQGNWVANTNHALSLAAGEYVCFLHQDDRWHPGRLKTIKKLVEQNPQIGLFLHDSDFINDKGQRLGKWSCPLPPHPTIVTPQMLIERLLIQNFISIPAPIFKRKTALNVGGLDETLWYTADWDLWLKIAKEGTTLYLPETLSDFRVHLHSQTIARSSYLHEFKKQLEDVLQKHFSVWNAPQKTKERVYKAAIFSIEVNTALAGTIHHQPINFFKLLASFLRLGPLQWQCYLVNSRIWERSTARIKAQLAGQKENSV